MKKKTKSSLTTHEEFFENLKREVLKVDPVYFAEQYLTIDGKPLKLSGGTGWKFLADIYRYIATTATQKNGKQVVCVKGRQVGATVMATALELYFMTSGVYGSSPEKPPIRILHCFPALALVQKFSKDKLATMMRTSTDNYVLEQSLGYDESGKKRRDVPDDTITEKQFKFENKLWVDSNANDAARLQGMTLDGIFYDEVQRMGQDDIGNSKRTLTAARYGPIGQGIQLYFGTPLQRGSFFHKMWEASDKRYYHLGCEKCGKYFILYTPGSDEWENIWLYGNVVKCTHCGHEQDKIDAVENGKWIPTVKKTDSGYEPQYVGFHFNQLLIPSFTRETVMKEKPINHATNTDRVWQNEILGEFYSGSDLPMTEEEIRENCRDPNRSLSFKMTDRTSSTTFMGIDWGGKTDTSKGGKSFSSVAIISVDESGMIRIENAFKLKRTDLQHKKDVVDEMYRRFGIQVTVADLGYGNDVVPEIQQSYGARFLGCLNSGSLTNPVKYDPEDIRLICNHNYILEELFGIMRKGRIKFPWASYEKIHWLIDHCTSMEKEDRVVAGTTVTRYVKGATPNDGLMALMYAYLAYKFYLTRGFKIKPHQKNGGILPAPILAHLPKM